MIQTQTTQPVEKDAILTMLTGLLKLHPRNRPVGPGPCHFTPKKKTLYPLYRRWVGPRGSLDSCKISSMPPKEFNVKPGASHYTHVMRAYRGCRDMAPL